MRLNKYIAAAGIASRRKADALTLAGQVKINGQVMKEPGYDVKDDDVVQVQGQVIEPVKRHVYLMLNKPKGYLSTVSDDRGRPTVIDLMGDVAERIFPVGRLDYDTSGLLLMTNDGDFAYQMTHPRHQVQKTYRARVSGTLSNERLARLRKGVDIGGFVTSAAVITVTKQMERSAIVEIKIHEGKNRQIRKMFATVGNKVMDLERVAIGDLYLGHLMSGHYRKLSRQEVERLMMD